MYLLEFARAVVCDGVCIGRACCALKGCSASTKGSARKYCTEHEHYEDECAVIGCNAPKVHDYTCNDPEHVDAANASIKSRSAYDAWWM